MIETVKYIIEVTACSGLFAAFYWLVLRNRSFHEWNRWYIVLSVPTALLLPLVKIPVRGVQTVSSLYQGLSPTFTAPPVGQTSHTAAATVAATSPLTAMDWMLVAAGTVALALILRETVSMLRIIRLKRTATPVDCDGTTLLYTDDPAAPFSFFRNIFWKADIQPASAEGRLILRHELAHVSHGHSWDRLLLQLACCTLWMNPFFHLLKRELIALHEFAADYDSVGTGGEAKLSALILSMIYPKFSDDLKNRFFHSSIKRRIKMINIKNQKHHIWNKLSAVPVILIALYLFSFEAIHTAVNAQTPTAAVTENHSKTDYPASALPTEKEWEAAASRLQPPPPPPPPPPPNSVRIVEDKPILFADLDVKPTFNGKDAVTGFREWIGKNTNYPAEAHEKGIMGKIFVQFIIESNGSVSNVKLLSFDRLTRTTKDGLTTPKITKVDVSKPVTDDGGLTIEALRVIRSSPKWTPGKVKGKAVRTQYQFPINFKLN